MSHDPFAVAAATLRMAGLEVSEEMSETTLKTKLAELEPKTEEEYYRMLHRPGTLLRFPVPCSHKAPDNGREIQTKKAIARRRKRNKNKKTHRK